MTCTNIDISQYYQNEINKAINKISKIENQLTQPFQDFKNEVTSSGSGTIDFNDVLDDVTRENLGFPTDDSELAECIGNSIENCLLKPTRMVFQEVSNMIDTKLDAISSLIGLPEKAISQSAYTLQQTINGLGLPGFVSYVDSLINCGTDQGLTGLVSSLTSDINDLIDNFNLFDNGTFNIEGLFDDATDLTQTLLNTNIKDLFSKLYGKYENGIKTVTGIMDDVQDGLSSIMSSGNSLGLPSISSSLTNAFSTPDLSNFTAPNGTDLIGNFGGMMGSIDLSSFGSSSGLSTSEGIKQIFEVGIPLPSMPTCPSTEYPNLNLSSALSSEMDSAKIKSINNIKSKKANELLSETRTKFGKAIVGEIGGTFSSSVPIEEVSAKNKTKNEKENVIASKANEAFDYLKERINDVFEKFSFLG